MEQNNRYDRYRDNDNRSSGYDNSRRNRFTGDDSEDQGYNDQSRYSRNQPRYWQGESDYNMQRNEHRSGQPYQGNDWRENNWKSGESNSYRSGQDYGNSYGMGSEYSQRNQSYNRDRNWNARNWGDRNFDRNENRNYGNKNERNERDWWDRTSDEVSSWFGDDDAKRRRRMDHMNESTHYGKGPKNYKRSQERIKEDLNERLSDDHYLDASDIEVEVNGTEVTLSGTVDSRHSKRKAEDIADWVSGVTHVQNNLRVKNTTETISADNNNESSRATKSGSTSLTNSRTNKEQHLHN